MMIVHVPDVSTWGLYTKCMICMLQVEYIVLVLLYNCMLWDSYNISDCDCQHGILYCRIYRSSLCVSDNVCIISAEFGTSHFC